MLWEVFIRHCEKFWSDIGRRFEGILGEGLKRYWEKVRVDLRWRFDFEGIMEEGLRGFREKGLREYWEKILWDMKKRFDEISGEGLRIYW